MSGNLKPGWCVEAGRIAGEIERGERRAMPTGPKRHYIPVLPAPKAGQIENIKRGNKRQRKERHISDVLDAVLGKVEE